MRQISKMFQVLLKLFARPFSVVTMHRIATDKEYRFEIVSAHDAKSSTAGSDQESNEILNTGNSLNENPSPDSRGKHGLSSIVSTDTGRVSTFSETEHGPFGLHVDQCHLTRNLPISLRKDLVGAYRRNRSCIIFFPR